MGVNDCYEVDNGLEAMRAIRRQDYTHVFLDLCLPIIDGVGRCKLDNHA